MVSRNSSSDRDVSKGDLVVVDNTFATPCRHQNPLELGATTSCFTHSINAVRNVRGRWRRRRRRGGRGGGPEMGGGAEGRPEGGAAAAGTWADRAEAAVEELEARAARQRAAAEATAASVGATGPARYAAETARRSAAAAATARRAVAGAKKGQQPPLPARPRPVPRVNAGELSLRAFRQELQRANAPVVLEGLGEHLTEDGAAFAELCWLRRCVGNKTVAVSERHAHAKACLDRADYALTTVGELLDAVDAGEAEGRYLYDCSMP